MASEINRAKIHEVAVQLMYSFLMLEETNNIIHFEDSVSAASGLPYEECDLFLKEVLIKSLKYQKPIMKYVQSYLKNWDFHRLNLTIQAIFIVSVTEFFFVEEKVEKPVIINNAVKYAKKFGDGGEKDYKYVNAVLQNCLDESKREILLNNAD